MLCTSDTLGNIVTWKATSGEVLGTFKPPTRCSEWSLVKLNNTQLAMLCGAKRIIILKHARGRDFEQAAEFYVGKIGEVSGLDGCGKSVVVIGIYGRAEIWDVSKKERTADFEIDGMMDLVKMGEKFIICGNRELGILKLYENSGDYEEVGSINLAKYFHQLDTYRKYPYIRKITLINLNLMMVACWLGIAFVSLDSREIVACFKIAGEDYNYCATILPDGRIQAAGDHGHCTTLEVPDVIRDDLKKYVGEIYKEPDVVPTNSPSTLASASDEEIEIDFGSRKRGRADYEDSGESADLSEIKSAVKTLQEKVQKTESGLGDHKNDVKKLLEAMKLEQEGRKEDMEKMEETLKLELEFQKAKRLKMEEVAEEERQSHIEDMRNIKMEIEYFKVTVINNHST